MNFLRDQPEKKNLIKRKTKSEQINKKDNNIPGVQGNELVIHPIKKFINFKEDKSKLNLIKMHKRALKLNEIVKNLKRKVEILEGKYDFLEYCNKEFGENNINIMNKLQNILEKKNSLENFFTFLITNFFPNLKLVDNTLPEPIDNKSTGQNINNNNQISDLRNNEIISQIYKLFYLNENNNNLSGNNININNINNNKIISNNNSIISNNKKNNNILNIISNEENKNFIYNKNKINQIIKQIVDTEQSNTEAKEINTYNKILDFQKKYFTDLEEQNTDNYINLSKESQSIIENNSIKSESNFKNDKDIMNVSSNNISLEVSDKSDNLNNKKLYKDNNKDNEGSISDGSKDLL